MLAYWYIVVKQILLRRKETGFNTERTENDATEDAKLRERKGGPGAFVVR